MNSTPAPAKPKLEPAQSLDNAVRVLQEAHDREPNEPTKTELAKAIEILKKQNLNEGPPIAPTNVTPGAETGPRPNPVKHTGATETEKIHD
jgi:hypothetical protein